MESEKDIKANQWLIDRAFNLNAENEQKIYGMLSYIKSVKEGFITEEQASIEMEQKKLIINIDRYKRSTATLLRSFGLISDAFSTTEIADCYVEGKISYKELLLLQLLKKENQYDEYSEVIKPVLVLLAVLNKIYSIDKSLCWVDTYDYQEVLTEIKNNADVDEAVNKIIALKSRADREPKYKINHFDVWTSALTTSGLFKYCEDKENCAITLNENEIDLINYILSKQNDFNGELFEKDGTLSKNERLEKFGKLNYSLLKGMPNISLSDSVVIRNLETDDRSILSLYLIEGESFRSIEKRVFGDEFDASGWIPKYIIKDRFGIDGDVYKGIWKPFKDYLGIIRICPKYSELNSITSKLFEEGSEEYMIDEANRAEGGSNVIYYGVPGCGKSKYISKHYDINEYNSERVVFHPDYTYSDFIGQVLPDRDDDGHICYPFKEGPLTRILKKAYSNPKETFYFIIEEINRGNAPAIFGDIFQLLDRTEKGNSVYKISNSEIAEVVYGDKNHFVSIPSNLTILATMNTADQNVFTLDTAFKRRWHMKCIPNDFDKCPWGDKKIIDSNITWATFATTINEKIVESQNATVSSEDKRLGAFFVAENELEDADAFSEKVLMYLWNDAFKYKHDTVFKQMYVTLEDLICAYKIGSFEAIFNDTIVFNEEHTDISEYLQTKTDIAKDYYNKFISKLKSSEIRFSQKVVQTYITLNAPNDKKKGFVFAEIHLGGSSYVQTKRPLTAHDIGENISDSNGWSINYKIPLNDSDMDEIIEIVLDSYNQIMDN